MASSCTQSEWLTYMIIIWYLKWISFSQTNSFYTIYLLYAYMIKYTPFPINAEHIFILIFLHNTYTNTRNLQHN